MFRRSIIAMCAIVIGINFLTWSSITVQAQQTGITATITSTMNTTAPAHSTGTDTTDTTAQIQQSTFTFDITTQKPRPFDQEMDLLIIVNDFPHPRQRSQTLIIYRSNLMKTLSTLPNYFEFGPSKTQVALMHVSKPSATLIMQLSGDQSEYQHNIQNLTSTISDDLPIAETQVANASTNVMWNQRPNAKKVALILAPHGASMLLHFGPIAAEMSKLRNDLNLDVYIVNAGRNVMFEKIAGEKKDGPNGNAAQVKKLNSINDIDETIVAWFYDSIIKKHPLLLLPTTPSPIQPSGGPQPSPVTQPSAGSDSPSQPAGTDSSVNPGVKENTPTPTTEETGFPWWGYLLIVLLVLAVIGVIIGAVFVVRRNRARRAGQTMRSGRDPLVKSARGPMPPPAGGPGMPPPPPSMPGPPRPPPPGMGSRGSGSMMFGSDKPVMEQGVVANLPDDGNIR